MVRLLGARSAEPPRNSGSTLPKVSSAFCEALRLAILAGLACSFSTKALASAFQLAGSSPFTRRLNSAASSGKAFA
ncbi:hypothetical protein D3C78_927200 [compost metagenome]